MDSAGRQKKNLKMDDRKFRRSIYVTVSRSKPLAVLDMFDAPKMEPNCEKRSSSTVAPQSLLMMNSAFMVENAELFAERLLKEKAGNKAEQVKLAWILTFGKEPSAEEVQQSTLLIHNCLNLKITKTLQAKLLSNSHWQHSVRHYSAVTPSCMSTDATHSSGFFEN